MQISGSISFGSDCTALEWIIGFFNGLTGPEARELLSQSGDVIDIQPPDIRIPGIPGQGPEDFASTIITLQGEGLSFVSALTPTARGMLTEITITTSVGGVRQSAFITFDEPIPLDDLLAETARNPERNGKRIEDNPNLARLFFPDGEPVDARGSPGDDLVKGYDSDDTLAGGAGDDTVMGQGGNDLISDFSGDDVLNGGSGRDTMDGGEGRDTFQGLVDEFHMDEIEALQQEDALQFLSFGSAFTGPGQFDLREGSLFISGPDVEIMLPNRDPVMNFEVTQAGDDVIFRLIDPAISRIGGDGPDEFVGARGHDTLSGGAGNDTLTGYDGDDRLLGEGDDDLLRGGNGNDTLNGGDGNDFILGGESEDDLRDVIFGGAGDDNVDAGYG
ncbi:calcium-binding protein, partial [Cribrihabitans sp. XS_ASV171]